MNSYFEDALKYNRVSGWRNALERMRLSFGAATEVHTKERTAEADFSDKPAEMDWRENWKERVGGFWW